MKSVVIFAGIDIFSIEQIPDMDDPQATYQAVSELVLPKVIADFGEGSELQMEDAHTFRINVDHVVIA
jgi:hypothetical protein